MTLTFRALKKSASPVFVAAALLTAAGTLPITAARAADSSGKVLFILDASGSMWGKVEGQDKIAIAKDVMTDLVRQLPDGIEAGLEAYGHRSKGQCDDIEILAAPARGNRDAMVKQIQSITPKGMTPITRSLELAAESLKGTEEQASIVLVSDGKETCEADPCAAVQSIRAQGINLRVHVVGFDVNDEERKQLQCIADAGGGKYFSADNAGQLAAALSEVRQAVTAAPAEPEKKKKTIKLAVTATVTTKNGVGRLFIADAQTGEDITNVGADGDRLEIPAGAYRLRYGAFDTTTVEIKAGETVTLDANSWTARVTTRNGVGRLFIGDPETDQDITNFAADGDTFQLPVGTYRLRYGSFEAGTIEVKAGDAVTLDATERTATLTTHHGAGRLFIADAQTGEDITNISADGDTILVAPGTYKLRFGQFDAGTIEVSAGDELVIE
jgi:Ca-activated chloride channel family protein